MNVLKKKKKWKKETKQTKPSDFLLEVKASMEIQSAKAVWSKTVMLPEQTLKMETSPAQWSKETKWKYKAKPNH